MKTHFFIIISFFLSFPTLGQELKIQGIIADKETEIALSNAIIEISSGEINYKTKSSFKGVFVLPMDANSKTIITVKKSGYLDYQLELKASKRELKNKLVVINIMLIPGELLPDVIISAPGYPKKVYGSKKHNVADFEFIDNSFLLLTYDKNPKKERKLLFVDSVMTIVFSKEIPLVDGAITGFERSYSDEILLNTSSKLYQVIIDTAITLIDVDRKIYTQQVKPIIDTLNNKVYLSNWYDKYPAFGYFEYSVIDSSYQLIREIADDFMLELCRAEYKYLSGRSKLLYYRQELELGIDKEILACIDNFDQGLYYDPIYAPMFIVRDTILIFDHCDDLLCRYTIDRQPIDSLEITYHQPGKKINKTFIESLLHDKETNKIYAQYQHQGGTAFLKEIDIQTGKIKKVFSLKYPYPSTVKIKNGYAYYIYRPFESLQKKYLYRERLVNSQI